MCEHGGIDELNTEGLLDIAERALRRAVKLPLGGAVSDVALTRLVQRLTAVERIVAGHRSSAIRELDQRQAAKGQAAGSTVDLLARTLHLSQGEARREAELAEGLAALPDTEQALKDGRIGVAQAHVAVKKANEVKDRQEGELLVKQIDQTAATAGQLMDRNRLARQIDTELAKTDMDVLADRERTAFQRRNLTWTVRDGMHVLHAELDAVGGSTVRAMLDRLSDKTDDKDPRSFPQRQADALVHMATLAKGNEGKPQTKLQSARVLLVSAPGVRAGAGTARRLSRGPALAWSSGTLSSPWAAPVAVPDHRRHPPARNAGRDVSGVRRGTRPRVLAMRQRHTRTAAGHTSARTRGLGRSRRPDSRDGTPRGGNCHTSIHQLGWQITRDGTGRYRAGPPDLVPPHLENSIAKHTHTYAHSR